MINYDDYKIRPRKHFLRSWMRKSSLDIDAIKDILKRNYKLDKVGKYKYESYIRKKERSIKIIFILDEEYKEIFIISGAEGK